MKACRGLRIAEKIGIQSLQVNIDSKLEANQVNGTYIAKETDMIKYLEKVKTLASTFRAFSIKQVPRSKNKKADLPKQYRFTSLRTLSKQGENFTLIRKEKKGTARAIKATFTSKLLHKPMSQDNSAGEKLESDSLSPWPVYKWGIEIGGPFLDGPRKVKFLIVAMDYFTKWIKAKSVATITGNQVKKFVWENIECRFGSSQDEITDFFIPTMEAILRKPIQRLV
ncbi:reverse transcriptase domain-containing protein [Tanacetum coccineum]